MENIKKTKNFHHGNLYQAMIDKALETIKETNGFNFSLRDIAQKVGVSHAAAYRHFSSKSDLIIKIATQGFQKFTNHIEKHARGASENGENPKGVIRALGRAYIDFALHNEGIYRTIFNGFEACKSSSSELLEVSMKSWIPLVSLVERGQNEGFFYNEDPNKLSIMIWSSLHGYVMLILDRQVNNNGENGSPLHLNVEDFLQNLERSIFK